MSTLRILLLGVTIMLYSPSQAAGQVVLLELEGAIGPASGDFVLRGLENAQRSGAGLVVLQLDTPGGLDSSMRDIIQAILTSPIPVATYVAPSGARAASAGTYILYASHIAAMAPATNLGAATPVQIGGLPSPTPTPSEEEQETQPAEKEKTEKSDNASANKDADGENDDEKGRDDGDTEAENTAMKPKTAMEKKIINDARAYIRSLAQLRGRNVNWAEDAVSEAASLSAQEALEQGVIDIVAVNVADLLKQADGRQVQVDGRQISLATAGAVVETIKPDWRNQLLAIITNPQVAYILMLLGIYGLFFELSNPGAIFPGVLGGICLLLALFAFQVLPINYAGLALILLGLMFMIGEAFMPSFGALGLGGLVAFIVGSLILWDEQNPGLGIPIGIVMGFALVSATLLIGLGTMMVRQRRRPVVSGDDSLLSTTAEVLEDFDGEGWVRVQSESWRAISDRPLHKGQQVRVSQRDGLVLAVKPVEANKEKS